MKKLVLVLAVLAFFAPMVSAQVVINPVTVQFTPSADHDAINPLDSTPMVARYEVRVFTESPLGTTPLFTLDLGKPTPVSNLITVTNAVWFSGLTPRTRYVAKVVAIGPTGEGVSDPSGPFGNVGNPQNPGAPILRR